MKVDIDALRKLIQVHEQNLLDLKLKKAKYGLDVPIYIIRQIEDEEHEIRSMQAMIHSEAAGRLQMPDISAEGLPVKVLFLSADPSDLTRLRLGEEVREIQEKIAMSRYRDRIQIFQHFSVRPVDITWALLDCQPAIVHFSGHGSNDGCLVFEDNSGKMLPVSPQVIAELFAEFQDQVKSVLLNACFSKSQAEAISEHIDYVIGMDRAIGDPMAIAFSIGFYQAIGAGRPVEMAYKMGCIQIGFTHPQDRTIPQLIKKTNAA